MNKITREIIEAIGMVSLFAVFIVMLDLFLTAYFNPDKTVTVYINSIGEKNLDLFCMIFTFVFGLFALILKFKDIKNVKNKNI